jgi:hypothetical protein
VGREVVWCANSERWNTSLAALFQKQLSSDELAMLLAQLRSMGAITIIESKVSYALPDMAA